MSQLFLLALIAFISITLNVALQFSQSNKIHIRGRIRPSLSMKAADNHNSFNSFDFGRLRKMRKQIQIHNLFVSLKYFSDTLKLHHFTLYVFILCY